MLIMRDAAREAPAALFLHCHSHIVDVRANTCNERTSKILRHDNTHTLLRTEANLILHRAHGTVQKSACVGCWQLLWHACCTITSIGSAFWCSEASVPRNAHMCQ